MLLGLDMDRPSYPYKPIQTVDSLCLALGIKETKLRSIARQAERMYIGPKPKSKKNGGIRYVFDTRAPLKPLLKKINQIFFRRVNYPNYLTGSLSGRDFVSNVEIHVGSHIVITEDIAKFFDCISSDAVYSVWHGFFKFSADVAGLLTALTTKDGYVYQGTPTSSYLANLVFWRTEPLLAQRLSEKGFRYSRYVDDITVSSVENFGSVDKSWVISQIYGMIGGAGFKAQRSKHSTLSASGPIRIMGLNANDKRLPKLPAQERAAIRAQLYQLEERYRVGVCDKEISSEVNRVSGRVGRLTRLHPTEGRALKLRLDAVRHGLRERDNQVQAACGALQSDVAGDGNFIHPMG